MNATGASVVASLADAQHACRQRARIAVAAAQAELERIALATDAPNLQDIEAADHLDRVAELLAQVLSP